MGHRIREWLYSRRNIVASLLAIGGLALHFVGLIGDPLWFPIVLGLYAIGFLLVPGETALSLRLDATNDSSAIKSQLDRLLRQIRGKVAADIYERASSIRDSILLTLPDDGSGFDGTDPSVYLIRQTALDYLPAALTAYLSLPSSYADRAIVPGGKTPHQVLLDQLGLMDARMREVADDIVRHDSERLIAHGRFLAERFGTSSLDLDAIVQPTAQAAEAGATAATAARSPASPPAVAADEKQVGRERVH